MVELTPGPPVGEVPTRFEATHVEDDPERCRITVLLDRAPVEGTELTLQESVSRPATADGQFVVYTSMGEPVRAELSRAVELLEVSRGEYRYELLQGTCRLTRGRIDATGPAATLEFEVPDVVYVTGEVRGSLRGPIPDLALSVSSDGAQVSNLARTDASGRFEFDFPAYGPIHLRPAWDDSLVLERLWPRTLLEPAIDPSSPHVSYVVEEALLHIVESPPSPLIADYEVQIVRMNGAEEGPRAPITLDALSSSRIYLKPGRYVIRRSFGIDEDDPVEVTLDDREVRELQLDCTSIGAIALDVIVSEPERRKLVIRVRDAAGDIVDFTGVHRPRAEAHEYRKAVAPGSYSVEVEARARGARSSAAPIDVWRGELYAAPGARAPLRVFLR